MIMIDFPEEILNRIAAAIESPTDLRNIAAVCTQLRLLVEPSHTQFRVIRAPLISPIWKKFTENRLLSKNVRVIEVQSEPPPRRCRCCDPDEPGDPLVIPAIFHDLEQPSVPDINRYDEDTLGARRAYNAAKNAMDLDAERILVSALKGMSGLTSFKWSRTPPLINRDQEDDIWITLVQYCPYLNSIDVVDGKKPYEIRPLQETDDPAYQRPSYNPNVCCINSIHYL